MGLLRRRAAERAAGERVLTSGEDAHEGWPAWTDRLARRPGVALVEGGRRTLGRPDDATSNRPLVTYVTVVRNNAAGIERAIESVLRQTYAHVEHVILDGASTDGTLSVIEGYQDRIAYFASERDAGVYDALNKAISLARGDLICVLNSDDWLEPDAARTAVDELDGAAATLILTGANARRAEPGSAEPVVFLHWKPAAVHEGCYFMCADVCHNGVYATRSAYERSGAYDATYEIAADFKWLMTCLDARVNFRYTNAITVNYVMGGASSDAEKHGRECVRVMHERFPSLTANEAGGLHHTFFVLPTYASVPGRPDDPAAFVADVLTRHADDPQLVRAAAWALLSRSGRRFDGDGSHDVGDGERGVRQGHLKSLVKRRLSDHPALYRSASRMYGTMRRR